MKSIRDILALSLTASLAVSTVAYAQSPEFNQGHAVFLMTNDAQSNEVVVCTTEM
jgi:hypothetical protein